jgi:hypothetical protein
MVDLGDDETPKRRVSDAREDRWHIGKEVPLAILIALVLQTGGGVWWLAQVSAKIDYAIATMEEFKRERYTREDARRDRELLEARVEANRAKDVEHERRLDMIERGAGGIRGR